MNKSFFKHSRITEPFVDATFDVAASAKKDPKAINVTMGTLCDEEGKLVAFDCIYNALDRVPNRRKAKYADSISGNAPFVKACYNWLNSADNLHLPYRGCASSGGTGAIYLMINNTLDEGETILLPSIGWGTYKLMAKQNGLNTEFYDLVDDCNEITLNSLFEKSRAIMAKDHKLAVLINDPAQNPTGLCYGKERWQKIIAFYNELAKEGKVILINDTAYIDFVDNSREYMEVFNDIHENILLGICMSCSKTFSIYGQRLGCCFVFNRHQEICDMAFNTMVRSVRSSWGSPNNGVMDAVADIFENHIEEYLKEKETWSSLLKQRAELFLEEAREVELPIYPYQYGFFITIRIKDQTLLAKVHQRMIDNHIYAARFSDGIRISICSLDLKRCITLPKRLKNILEECAHE